MGSLGVPTIPNTLSDNQDPSRAHLPAILCLHGGGSNATVFKIQTRRLYWRLLSRFRFVFVQGPIEGEPGWGMLPTFESLTPFYRWVSWRFKVGSATVEQTPMDEVEVIDGIILKAMEENGGRDKFVGVMGFSQGARMAAGMLLRQQLEIKEYGFSKWNFQFGVIIGGPFPPISLTPEGVEVDYSVMGQIPTVHAWGREDHVGEGAKQMADACDSPHTFFMDFEGGHHLPLKDKEADELCGLIIEAWHAAGGEDSRRRMDNSATTY